ncbi:transglutaminase TgpA family protein [Aphanothece sacrum]|uniref:Transglutaminase domain protein n=1 Tax=Aphanothece sacrum FPU1 TaxID=1920663 RepID=A0A401ID81_APHSA|nr:transglutaminaseTgpA domain-containing protein [Aphanothece sacrum]GBF79263.1 transglutaminase domain protein [Aphanothece sacrum FPU1]GBF86765.1 transglutaminase domain protein [Aphanothece sacrum FPU3]
MENTNSQQLPFFEKFRQKIAAMPLPQTEESLLLRILVQGLVIVGIIATDVAAQTQMSLWAIPLSILGATWSWYRRKYPNITIKFFLAIGMLGVLFFFLINLTQNLNDSRLTLAGLLVQLQVLHSFDLPRRKDLGYSMIIGLILLGVAGTVSQTLAFAPWLLLFLILAIPTLVLDYRSRLGLKSINLSLKSLFYSPSSVPNSQGSFWQYSPLSPSRLSVILGITLLLGLGIFLVMPRFPGYQLQTFPVSSPLDADSQKFEQKNRDIINPGYAQNGQKNNQNNGGEGSPSEGTGQFNSNYYYGFNTKINQNLRGEMKPKVVLRVRSQAPGFWRALSFDYYTGQGWEISGDKDLKTINRDLWSYKFFLPSTGTYMKTKEVIQSYTAVSELPNVIPTLYSPTSLYFPAKEIAQDPQNNLRSPVGLIEGLTYTVISEVPYRNRTVLNKSPYKYSQEIKDTYLQIPSEISEKVRKKTLELISTSEKPLNSTYEAALFLTQKVKQLYRIQPDLPFFDDQEDLVEAFLFKYEGGYQDHFSTVLTMMLRSIGIPARLTVGFGAGKFNPFTGFYIVKNTDAYALTEAYFPYFGWYGFDPIPGHDLIPPSVEEDQTFGVLKQFWNWVAGWLPSPITGFFNVIWTYVIGGFLSLLLLIWEFISGSLIGVFVGLLLGIGLAFLGWLGWGQLSKLGYHRQLAKLPPMARLYQEMLGVLKGKGYPKHPAQTPLEYVEVSRQQHPSEQAEIIAEISQAYVSWRYGENTQNLEYLQQQFQALVKSLKPKNSN